MYGSVKLEIKYEADQFIFSTMKIVQMKKDPQKNKRTSLTSNKLLHEALQMPYHNEAQRARMVQQRNLPA